VALAQRDWQQAAIQLSKLQKEDLPELIWQHLMLRIAFANALHAIEEGERNHWTETAKAHLEQFKAAQYKTPNPSTLDIELFTALEHCLNNDKNSFNSTITQLKNKYPDSHDLINQFVEIAD
jgi:hypothetical protein